MKWSARKKKGIKNQKKEEIIRYKTKEMNILSQYHQRISRHYVILADMSSYTSFPLALSVWKQTIIKQLWFRIIKFYIVFFLL